MGNENEKQHSPTKTNTNPYKTFIINTYQCIDYDYIKMAPQNTSRFGTEQQNKQKPQHRHQHQNKEDKAIKHTNIFVIKHYYIVIKEV